MTPGAGGVDNTTLAIGSADGKDSMVDCGVEVDDAADAADVGVETADADEGVRGWEEVTSPSTPPLPIPDDVDVDDANVASFF